MYVLLQVFVYGNESKFDKFRQVNASVHEVLIADVIASMKYRVQVLAFNRIGESSKSRYVGVGECNVNAYMTSLSVQLVS